MFIRAGYVLILLLAGALPAVQADSKPVTVCLDNYPPLQIQQADGSWIGESVVVVEALFERIGYPVRFSPNIPFQRCLNMIEKGQMDVMPGLLYSDKRAQMAHMVKYSDALKVNFYVQPGTQILRFSDLKGKWVAFVRGAIFFPEFDEVAPGYLNKVEVNSLLAALQLLQKGRVDTVLCTEIGCERLLQEYPEFRKLARAPYDVVKEEAAYLALSRHTFSHQQASQIQRAANTMLNSGEFQQLIQDFKQQYVHYYQP